jgi:hypothetical protein
MARALEIIYEKAIRFCNAEQRTQSFHRFAKIGGIRASALQNAD